MSALSTDPDVIRKNNYISSAMIGGLGLLGIGIGITGSILESKRATELREQALKEGKEAPPKQLSAAAIVAIIVACVSTLPILYAGYNAYSTYNTRKRKLP